MCDTAIAGSGQDAIAYMKAIDAFAQSWPAVMCKIWIKITGSPYTFNAWVDVGPDDIAVFPDSYSTCTIVDKTATFTADIDGKITSTHNATSMVTVAMVMTMLVILLVQMFL